jgi:hypothetical protein
MCRKRKRGAPANCPFSLAAHAVILFSNAHRACSAYHAFSNHLHSLQVEGRNEPGIAAKVTQKIGQAGLNLRGFSGAVIGTQFVLHLAFDTAEAAQKAIAVLRQ